ncbi:MAG: phosphoribosylglycinamide formyltransferase [Candidatus Diapherotrites archaeon CG11_big_fil_rev_8_21_14_0_20_37_9]|nr:MAG: phosphoribosylglycinamide formyltransferase [Candidatus Diapherotrites archaeon CG11_big_fil_rev_8_21_14_0_20_37_9]
MRKLILGILGSTKGTDLQAIIDAIENKKLDAKIAVVCSDKKDAFIIERAEKHGIETLYVNYKEFSERKEAEKIIAEKFKEKGVQLILLIGFMKIISPYFVNEFKGKIWNIHPSLLPKYAGGMNLDVHKEVLKNNEKETGCTLHEVTEKVDAGKIILQKKVKIEKNETPDSLRLKVQKKEQECFLEALKMITEDKIIIG